MPTNHRRTLLKAASSAGVLATLGVAAAILAVAGEAPPNTG